MKTLILNSYAGSLTLGAKHLGCEIIGSYEDSNFGLDIQKHNFPDLEYREYRHQWPKQDLSDTFVIAHPPCSAFSVQNCSPSARGVDSGAFACTKSVLQYACENNAVGIAIESVMGALGGAWWTHQRYADDHGYNLYRILENGAMFGCQWRERFWVLYLKKGAAPNKIPVTITPRWKTVSEVITGHEEGPSAGNQDRLLDKQKARLIEEAGLSDDEMQFLFNPPPHHRTAALGTILYETKFKRPESTARDKWEVFKKYIGGFASGTMVYLDPNGYSPVLMGGSHWYVNGRNLSESGFKRVMGFPAEYAFPTSPRNMRTQLRMYLSKGVMPPIAAWILENAAAALGYALTTQDHIPGAGSYTIEAEPDGIVDFRIRKDDWWERYDKLPELRHFDEVRPSGKSFIIMEEELTSAQRAALKAAQDQLADVLRTFDTAYGMDVAIGLQHTIAQTGVTIAEAFRKLEVVLNPPPEPVDAPKAKAVKVKVERAPRVTGKVQPLRATRMMGQHIRTAPSWPGGTGLTDKKREQMYNIISTLGITTLEDAIAACAAPLNILPTTTRWHIRQMMAAGTILEATATEVEFGKLDSIPNETDATIDWADTTSEMQREP